MWLFQFLIGMYLILHQFCLMLGIALNDIVASILSNAFLYYFISAILDDLDLFVFTLYHQYNINIKQECLRPRFIYLSASLAPERPRLFGSFWRARKRRDMQWFKINSRRGRWGSSSHLLWIRAVRHSVASWNCRTGASAAALSRSILIQRRPYRRCIVHHQQYGSAQYRSINQWVGWSSFIPQTILVRLIDENRCNSSFCDYNGFSKKMEISKIRSSFL